MSVSRLSEVDPTSFSTPQLVVVKHLELDLNISFPRKTLSGTATLKLHVEDPAIQPKELV